MSLKNFFKKLIGSPEESQNKQDNQSNGPTGSAQEPQSDVVYDFASQFPNPTSPVVVGVPLYNMAIKKGAGNASLQLSDMGGIAAYTLRMAYLHMLLGEKVYHEITPTVLEQKCCSGDATAINLYGELRLKGIIIEEDKSKAFMAFNDAHRRGDVAATYNLAMCYANGWGVGQDMKRAFSLCSEAAEKNYPKAQAMLSQWYKEGTVVKKDTAKAFSLCEQAARAGELSAQVFMMLDFSTHDKRTAANTANWAFNDAMFSKDKDLVLVVADALEYGVIGGHSHPEHALILRVLGAVLGDEQATEQLKEMPAGQVSQILIYIIERKMELKQFDVAFLCAQRMAQQEDSSGYQYMGWMYEKGLGVEQDMGKAFENFTKSHELGNPQGACSMAVCYVNGNGVAKDMQRAFDLFSESAAAGNPLALSNLAVFYRQGIIVGQDIQKADELTQKAKDILASMEKDDGQ